MKFPRHYRTCLLSQGNIARLALCLVRIELKASQAQIHWFEIWCELQVSHEYLTIISLNCRCGLHLKLKELLYSTLKNTRIE